MDRKDLTIKTQVDDLINLLKKEGKLSIKEAAKKLNVSVEVLQSWVDFLVEEEIIGIEYKFTTPYIFINKTENKEDVVEVDIEQPSLDDFKANYYKMAAKKNIPPEEIEELWKQHLMNVVELRKDFFYREAKKRGLTNIDELWENYIDQLFSKA